MCELHQVQKDAAWIRRVLKKSVCMGGPPRPAPSHIIIAARRGVTEGHPHRAGKFSLKVDLFGGTDQAEEGEGG